MNKSVLQNVTLLIGASLILASATYVINLKLFSLHSRVSSVDTLFLEAIFFISIGALLFLGSGGISRTSQKAAMLASAAKALGKEVIGPSEIFRRDAWKPKGFTRLALTLIMTGIILLIIYFVSL